MLFHSIYTTKLATSFCPKLMLFGACGVLIIFALLMILVPRIEPDNRRRGVLVQAVFRSNFVIMGVPIVKDIFKNPMILGGIFGATFKLGSTHAHRKQLLGAIFASPCAVVSFAMAQQMGGDADLAGNCVVFTSALSCFTIFCWILLFKTLGIF